MCRIRCVALAAPILFGLALLHTSCQDRDAPPGNTPGGSPGATRDSGLAELDIERIRSIPYLSWQAVEPADRPASGITLYEPGSTAPGLNFFNIDGEPTAQLMDMRGRVLHTWSVPGEGWHHAEPGDRGTLFAIVQDEMLLKLDWDSRLLWSCPGRFHHDIGFDPHGNLIALERVERNVLFHGLTVPILDEHVVTLSPSGERQESLSLWDLLGDQVADTTLAAIGRFLHSRPHDKTIATYDSLGVLCDVFHANSIEYVQQDIQGVCRAGDFLISIRQLNRIAFIDPAQRQVRWQWGAGTLWRQHHPSLLENGHILLFDNRNRRESSRVVEVDPRNGGIVWTYWPRARGDFFSRLRGSCQRLGNQNTLITVSDKGRVIEVTPTGEIVWEFWNELDPGGRLRRAIYRMSRIEPGSNVLPLGWSAGR